MSINNPDVDPANNYSLVGSINFAFQKLMQSMNNMLPAIVTAYDRETNRVSVQIAINLTTTDGSQVPRPRLVNIPVLILGGGTFSISFPLNEGDLGWILANDRDISLFLQNYQQTAANTTRTNNFADGLFIPDLMKTYNYSESTEGYFVIQSIDGTMSIEMGVNPSTTAHELNINVDRLNLTVNGGLGYLNVDGNLFVSGLIENPTGVVTPVPVVPPFPP